MQCTRLRILYQPKNYFLKNQNSRLWILMILLGIPVFLENQVNISKIIKIHGREFWFFKKKSADKELWAECIARKIKCIAIFISSKSSPAHQQLCFKMTLGDCTKWRKAVFVNKICQKMLQKYENYICMLHEPSFDEFECFGKYLGHCEVICFTQRCFVAV